MLLATLAVGAAAHEVRPAYLELRQTAPDTQDVLWKVPGRGENLRLGLYGELPDGSTNLTVPRAAMVDAAFTLAHGLTLAGATLGWVHVPGPLWRPRSRCRSCSWPPGSCTAGRAAAA
ncbi:MAG: hypothetical protein OEW22_10425 [Rubrivivax sp.]|nr:hypothetical protein [Rubrivivax sp.]